MLTALVGCASAGAGLAEEEDDHRLKEGRRLFIQHCSSCHSTSPGQVVVGPSLDGIAGRAGERIAGVGAEAYLRASIERPGEYLVDGFADLMPSSLADSLSEQEMEALVGFLLSMD